MSSLLHTGRRCADTRTGFLLRRRLVKAVAEHAEQEELFQIFSNSLEDVNTALWQAQVEAWEHDFSLPDPYVSTATGTHIHYSYSYSNSCTSM